MLSTACLYALMSFTVAKRTRECAIRTALGAQPASIVFEIARKVLIQLSVGVLIGATLSAGMLSGFKNREVLRIPNWPLNLGLITLFVIVVGLLACVKPTLRALRIRPVEVLRS